MHAILVAVLTTFPFRFMPRDIRTALVPLSDVLRLPKEETSPAAALCGHTYALWLRLEDATGQVSCCWDPRTWIPERREGASRTPTRPFHRAVVYLLSRQNLTPSSLFFANPAS